MEKYQWLHPRQATAIPKIQSLSITDEEYENAKEPAPRIARSQTREDQIVALLTRRRGEKLTATEISEALKAGYVENVRATLKRLAARRMIAVDYERRLYRVGNAVCRHKAALWYVAP